MNFKERGITVGDLLILILAILITTIAFKSFKKDKQTSINQSNLEKISHNLSIYRNII